MGGEPTDTWDLTGLQPPANGVTASALERAAFDLTDPGYHPAQVDELVERAVGTVRYYEREAIPALVEQIARRDEHIARLMAELSATRVTGRVLVDEHGVPISISEAERVELEYLRSLHQRDSDSGLRPTGAGPDESLPRRPLPPHQ